VERRADAGAQQALELGVALYRHAEGGGDGRQRHVVVRGPDAARREHEVVARREQAHGLGDLGLDVGDDLDARQRDTELAQLTRQEARVLVLDLAGQQLVANQQDRGPGRHPSILHA
jgi:hypothetical protein